MGAVMAKNPDEKDSNAAKVARREREAGKACKGSKAQNEADRP